MATKTAETKVTLHDGEIVEVPENKVTFAKWARRMGWRHVVGIAAVVFAAFPILYVLSASLDPSGTMSGSTGLFRKISIQNYQDLFHQTNRPYGRWYLNTIGLATVTAIFTVLFSALAAYAFSRLRFTGRRTGLLSLMLIQMFPQLLNVVAIFLLLTEFGKVLPILGLGSLVALMCVYLGGALGANTYLMYGFFNSVPKALDEAAKVDGAGHARTFFTILLPLVVPTLAVVGLLSFINTFNEFAIASVGGRHGPEPADAGARALPIHLGRDELQLAVVHRRHRAGLPAGAGGLLLAAALPDRWPDFGRGQVGRCATTHPATPCRLPAGGS